MLSIQIPQCLVQTKDLPPTAGSKYLLVAGGRAPSAGWLAAVAAGRVVVCADRGVSYCRRAGVRPAMLLGDGDSARADWQWAEGCGVPAEKQPRDKDLTDLQIALAYIARQKDCAQLLVTGIWGGRFDHAYSALFSLLSCSAALAAPVVLADQKEFLLFSGTGHGWSVGFARRPQVVSVLPLSGQAKVTLAGCRWELEDAPLRQSHPYAVSNRLRRGARQLGFAASGGEAGLYLAWQ